jgi:uncharacterized iron-regulated membrane protein
MTRDVQERKVLYATVWRWHFYAGLYVAPFLMLLAFTGLVMLAAAPIERWQLGDLLTNTPGGIFTSHQARLDAARAAFPHATFVRYQPGRDDAESARIAVTLDDRPHTVFVDAGTGHVRGIVDDADRIGVVAQLVHGTLLIGAWGDRLLEIAASLGILLIVSGMYLWWQSGSPFWPSLRMTGGTSRLAWRDVHKTTGVILAPVLAFYLISGLASRRHTHTKPSTLVPTRSYRGIWSRPLCRRRRRTRATTASPSIPPSPWLSTKGSVNDSGWVSRTG